MFWYVFLLSLVKVYLPRHFCCGWPSIWLGIRVINCVGNSNPCIAFDLLYWLKIPHLFEWIFLLWKQGNIFLKMPFLYQPYNPKHIHDLPDISRIFFFDSPMVFFKASLFDSRYYRYRISMYFVCIGKKCNVITRCLLRNILPCFMY